MLEFKDLPYNIYEFDEMIQMIYEDYPEIRDRFGRELLNLADLLDKIREYGIKEL